MFFIKFMFKTLLILVLVLVGVSFYGIYSARALPDWFDESKADADFANESINKQLNKGGVDFLAQKSLDILRGNVAFDEDEFNALLMVSLKADADGRKLLSVSDGVRAFLRDGEIEISAVINMNKLEKVEPKARSFVDKFDKLFWIIEDGRIAVSLYGTPVVRRGGIGVQTDFHVKVGEIAFSNDTLRSLKVPVERAKRTQIAVKYLTLKSVNVKHQKIHFGVQPRF